MTANEFNALCEEHTIHPSIALENEEIVKALFEKNDKEVEKLLKEAF